MFTVVSECSFAYPESKFRYFKVEIGGVLHTVKEDGKIIGYGPGSNDVLLRENGMDHIARSTIPGLRFVYKIPDFAPPEVGTIENAPVLKV